MSRQRRPNKPILSLGPGLYDASALRQRALALGYKVVSATWSSSGGSTIVVEDSDGKKRVLPAGALNEPAEKPS